MKLTKEECESALKGIDSYLDNEYDEHDNKLTAYFSWHLITLENLIKEHFDNLPLKFEEIEEGMWVWDKRAKGYFKIYGVFENLRGNKFVEFYCDGTLISYEFEEGRYHAREVKE